MAESGGIVMGIPGTVEGVFRDGRVELLEEPPENVSGKVIITVLSTPFEELPPSDAPTPMRREGELLVYDGFSCVPPSFGLDFGESEYFDCFVYCFCFDISLPFIRGIQKKAGPCRARRLNRMAVFGETFVPSENDTEKAKDFSRILAREFAPATRVRIQRESDGEAIEIPSPVFNIFMKVLAVMSEGKAFSLIPMEQELTTQQAADILNVSRPYLNKILDLNEIPHRKVGRNRRVKFADLLDYKKQQEEKSKVALEELADEAQELDMGY